MYTVDNPIFEAVYKAADGNVRRVTRILEAISGLENNNDKLDFVIALATAKTFDQSAEWRAADEARQIKNEKEQVTRELRYMMILKWVVDNVKPGMMIKVIGTRDGQGWRKVIRWKNHNILECQKYSRTLMPTGENTKTGQRILEETWNEEPYITNHMSKKVIAVMINNKWKKVVDLIKEEKNE